MASIDALLKQHRLIALDTCLWIYHFERHPKFSKAAERILSAVNILLEAAQLRALHGFRTPDAIILETEKEHRTTLMVTNDQSWSKFPDLAMLCLSEPVSFHDS